MSSVKEKRAGELKKLQNMTLKEKFEYIWEYYNLWIIGGLVAVFLLGSAMNRYLINPPPKTWVTVTFLGTYLPEEIAGALMEDIDLNLVPDREKEESYCDSYYFEDEDPQVNSVMAQKFTASLAAREIDIIVAKEGYFQSIASEGIMMDLREAFTQEELDALGDSLAYTPIIELDSSTGEVLSQSEDMPFGIALKGNQYFKNLGLNMDNWYLCFAANTRRLDNGKTAMAYIWKE